VRTALASSLNVPAVRTLEVVGLDRFHDALKRLGFGTLTESDEYYGAALALGGGDVTLLALTNAYRVLADGGEWSVPRFVASKNAVVPRRIYSREAAFIVADILADRGARAVTFGLENPLATRVWSAAKTGTSKDMRDNWCVGFTSRYTVGVWVGNFSGAPMHDVSGVTGAAPIWRDIVHRLHRVQPSLPPAQPSGVSRRNVVFEPEVEPARGEWFLRGTETEVVRDLAGASAIAATSPRIRYPAEDTVIALDPDIPNGAERIVFEASPAQPSLRWRIDDVVLADSGGRADWQPQPGRHLLVLEDEEGRLLSSVSFEVRGHQRAQD
jgi:penicillin-binding protein 1C